MALFSRNKKTEAKEMKVAKASAPAVRATGTLPTDRNLESVIIGPRITEKAVRQGEKNVYTFTVVRNATKRDVADAVRMLFGVTPVKVNIVNKSPRQFMSRGKGRTISEQGMKKAYVYLKMGDHIDLV